MDYYQYINETGVIVPDVDEVKQDVENEFITAFGSNFDLSPSTPQGRLIELETLARQNTIAVNALNANQLNIRTATGQVLDAIGAFFGVDRAGGTKTRVLATISGVAGTVIPATSIAKTEAGDEFYSENEITIPAGGTTQGYFLSVEIGAIPCAVNTLTEIVSQTSGWESINNPASALLGTEKESDFDFRNRILNTRFKGISLIQSIAAELNQVENLLSSFVYDNGQDEAIEYQGIEIPAHSILVIADGGSDIDVATAIFNKKSSGSGYTAIAGQSVTKSVIDGSYQVSYDVTFNRPDYLDFDCSIEVRQNAYTGTAAELIEDVKKAIIDWSLNKVTGVDGLKIGQNVSPYEIGAAVSAQIPGLYVKNCLICDHGGTPAASELTCTVAEKYQIENANISVTVV